MQGKGKQGKGGVGEAGHGKIRPGQARQAGARKEKGKKGQGRLETQGEGKQEGRVRKGKGLLRKARPSFVGCLGGAVTREEEENSSDILYLMHPLALCSMSGPAVLRIPQSCNGDGELSEAPAIRGWLLMCSVPWTLMDTVDSERIHPRVMRHLLRELAKPQMDAGIYSVCM